MPLANARGSEISVRAARVSKRPEQTVWKMAVTKSEQDGNHPVSHYLVVEDPEHPSTWHLRVRDANGNLNHTLMGAAWAALHGGYRGKKYEGPGRDAALAKLKALYKSEGMELPSDQSRDFPQPRRDGAGFGIRDSGECRHLAVLLNGPGARIPNPESRTPRYEIPIALTGTWVKDGHKLSITADDLSAMVRNFEKRKNDQVVIDYEHASENPEVARGGAVPAAGWIHQLTVGSRQSAVGSNGNGDALYDLVEWTPDAERMIKAGQYRFFSPAIDWNYADKTTGEPQGATLTSGALTNHPFLEELPPIMLTDLQREQPRPDGVSGGTGYSPVPTGSREEQGADVSTGYLDAPLRTISVGYPEPRTPNPEPPRKFNGGNKAKSKKLSIKKMTADSSPDGSQGHHGIFDGDDFLGHVPADDMKDHVKSCMEDGFGDLDDLARSPDGAGPVAPPKSTNGKGMAGVKGHQEPGEPDGDEAAEHAAALLLRDSGFGVRDSGKPRDQILAVLKLAATHQLVEQREAARTLLLTECLATPESRPAPSGDRARTPNPDGFNTEQAKLLLRDGKITAADLLDAIEARDALSQAVQQGKILPKDRAFFFEIAMSNPKKFADYIAGAVPVVRFGSVGFGSAEQLPVDQEVDIETKKLMTEKSVSYGKAMKELFRSNPALETRYRSAHRQAPKDGSAAGVAQ
jgi:hypothetical protein